MSKHERRDITPPNQTRGDKPVTKQPPPERRDEPRPKHTDPREPVTDAVQDSHTPTQDLDA